MYCVELLRTSLLVVDIVPHRPAVTVLLCGTMSYRLAETVDFVFACGFSSLLPYLLSEDKPPPPPPPLPLPLPPPHLKRRA